MSLLRTALPFALAGALLGPASAHAIFHGRAVAHDEAPWLVALQRNGTVCGGVLVARDRVLTAAHCVQGADPARLRVELGAGPAPGATRHLRFDRVVFPARFADLPSPDFPEDPRRSGSTHDLAVLRLTTPVDDVAPLPLATLPPEPGEATTTYGRGRVGPVDRHAPAGAPAADTGRGPVAARAADQLVLAPPACGEPYGALLRPSAHLCTLDATDTRAQACGGDSGGPVVVRRDGRAELVALVTWGGETRGRDCGEGLPDVSERVAPHAALVAGTFAAPAPYATRRTRVRRADGVLECVSGPWRPTDAKLRVSWYREGGRISQEVAPGVTRLSRAPDRLLPGVHATRIRARKDPLGCTVRAETRGGWAQERSYNQR